MNPSDHDGSANTSAAVQDEANAGAVNGSAVYGTNGSAVHINGDGSTGNGPNGVAQPPRRGRPPKSVKPSEQANQAKQAPPELPTVVIDDESPDGTGGLDSHWPGSAITVKPRRLIIDGEALQGDQIDGFAEMILGKPVWLTDSVRRVQCTAGAYREDGWLALKPHWGTTQSVVVNGCEASGRPVDGSGDDGHGVGMRDGRFDPLEHISRGIRKVREVEAREAELDGVTIGDEGEIESPKELNVDNLVREMIAKARPHLGGPR